MKKIKMRLEQIKQNDCKTVLFDGLAECYENCANALVYQEDNTLVLLRPEATQMLMVRLGETRIMINFDTVNQSTGYWCHDVGKTKLEIKTNTYSYNKDHIKLEYDSIINGEFSEKCSFEWMLGGE